MDGCICFYYYMFICCVRVVCVCRILFTCVCSWTNGKLIVNSINNPFIPHPRRNNQLCNDKKSIFWRRFLVINLSLCLEPSMLFYEIHGVNTFVSKQIWYYNLNCQSAEINENMSDFECYKRHTKDLWDKCRNKQDRSVDNN